MIKTLKLANFKCHRDVVIDFTPGLNVIRGANESGKSTLYHAIAYALWGSRALPESLEQTVTWGEPAGSLKVTLLFEHAGEDYTIERSRSGAELTGPDVVAAGQAEVTAFVERLFGANYRVGFATLLASQSALQQGLDSSAVSLIEQLANMGAIDEYIEKIRNNLPTGSTKGLEAQLEHYSELVKPEADFTQLEAERVSKAVELEAAREAAKKATEEAAVAADFAANAQRRLLEQAHLDGARASDERRLNEARRALAAPPPEVPALDLTGLEAAALAQQDAAEVRRAWEAFQALPACAERTPASAFVLAARGWAEDLKATNERLQRIRETLAGARAQVITQTMCGLCGKDLENVPEVQQTNASLANQIEALSAELAAEEKLRSSLQVRLDKAKLLDQMHARVLGEAAALRQYVALDTSVVPALVTWAGPEVPSVTDTADYGSLLRQAREDHRKYQDALRERQELGERVRRLEEELSKGCYALALPDDKQTVLRGDVMKREAQAATVKLHEASRQAEVAEWALASAKKEHETLLAAWSANTKAKEELETLLRQTVIHNTLVKKLREVRVEVAKELWNMVLTGVSQIFSHIRGVPTVVSRAQDGFALDGRPVSSYSGSTKDALGLAIRIMLQKTFLGNLGFLLLDEPAAACDAEREIDMLAAVARAEFNQVILVTHSDRADPLASKLVSL